MTNCASSRALPAAPPPNLPLGEARKRGSAACDEGACNLLQLEKLKKHIRGPRKLAQEHHDSTTVAPNPPENCSKVTFGIVEQIIEGLYQGTTAMQGGGEWVSAVSRKARVCHRRGRRKVMNSDNPYCTHYLGALTRRLEQPGICGWRV